MPRRRHRACACALSCPLRQVGGAARRGSCSLPFQSVEETCVPQGGVALWEALAALPAGEGARVDPDRFGEVSLAQPGRLSDRPCGAGTCALVETLEDFRVHHEGGSLNFEVSLDATWTCPD